GSDPVKSNLFDAFLLDRQDVANNLAANNPYSDKSNLKTGGTDGYSLNQQDVLLGAFYRTYTGRNIKDYNTRHIFPQMPLPNWTVTWDGLGKLPAFKKTFRSITVRHAYRSNYMINAYTNNLLYNQEDAFSQDQRMPIAVASGTNPVNLNFVPF